MNHKKLSVIKTLFGMLEPHSHEKPNHNQTHFSHYETAACLFEDVLHGEQPRNVHIATVLAF